MRTKEKQEYESPAVKVVEYYARGLLCVSNATVNGNPVDVDDYEYMDDEFKF